MTTRYDFRDFSRIEVIGFFVVDIGMSDIYSVSVASEHRGQVKIEKSGNTLHIGRKGMGWWSFWRERPHAYVTMPMLECIALSGAGQGTVQGFKSDRALEVRLSGASHLEVRDTSCGTLVTDVSGASNLVGDTIAAAETELVISGASRAELSGRSGKARIGLSGASQARLSRLILDDTKLESSGASSAQLTIDGRLDLDLSGASKVEYSGNAIMGDLKVTGASTVKHR